MSDYRRWISYIYAYENGVKKRSAGYAKLELKDGRLSMTLHITPDGREGSLQVCMYKCHGGSREGVLLGSVEKRQGGEGVRFEEDAADLKGSGLLFQEMNGLLLYDDKGKYLISSWEDEPVEISALREIVAQMEQKRENMENRTGMKGREDSAKEESKEEKVESVEVENIAKERGGEDTVGEKKMMDTGNEKSAEIAGGSENMKKAAEEEHMDNRTEEERKTWRSRLKDSEKAQPSQEAETGQARELSPTPAENKMPEMKAQSVDAADAKGDKRVKAPQGNMETESSGITSYFARPGKESGAKQELHTMNEAKVPLQAPSLNAADISAPKAKQTLQPDNLATGKEDSLQKEMLSERGIFSEKENASVNDILSGKEAAGKEKAQAEKEISLEKQTLTEKEITAEKSMPAKKEISAEKPMSAKKEISAEKPIISEKENSEEKPVISEKENSPEKPVISEKENSEEKPVPTEKEISPENQMLSEKEISAEKSDFSQTGAVSLPGRLEARLFSCLPTMYPFEHQEFERSVRMEPQDIGLLPREMWKYAGNSFLLHSYYAYHHILFVRKVRKEQRNCYLMLPGVYNPKEQHMAQLFGFSRFCPVRKKALQQGDFGYWYMEVQFPE